MKRFFALDSDNEDSEDEKHLCIEIEDMVIQKHDQEFARKYSEFACDIFDPVTKVKLDGYTDFQVLDSWTASMYKMFKRRSARSTEKNKD